MLGRLLDLVVLFDVTGSMTGEINAMKEVVGRLAEELAAGGLRWRLGLFSFRDLKEDEDITWHGFTESAGEFKGWLKGLEAAGGGANGGESSLDTILRALRLQFRDQAHVIFALVTDEPPHDPAETGESLDDVIRQLGRKAIPIYVIGPEDPAYRELTDHTGGIHFDLEDDARSFHRAILSMGKSISETVAMQQDLRSAARRALGQR